MLSFATILAQTLAAAALISSSSATDVDRARSLLANKDGYQFVSSLDIQQALGSHRRLRGLFLEEEDPRDLLQNASWDQVEQIFGPLGRRLQCQCGSGVVGSGVGYGLQEDGNYGCSTCFLPGPGEEFDPVSLTDDQLLLPEDDPNFFLSDPEDNETPPPTIDPGERRLQESEPMVAVYDIGLKGFHVVLKRTIDDMMSN